MKPPRNAVVGEGDTVHMPIATQAFDWEVELAAVIGTTARNVTVEDAMSHVAGWTVAIDFSARDHNRAAETFYKLDWVAGKANDTCCPLGPRIVPVGALPDPQDTGLTLDVNGVRKQDGRSSEMIFSIAEQISIASRIMTLDPGDVLLTGTPRRGRRTQGHLPGGWRQGRCRDRGYRHAVRPNPALALGDMV